VAPTDNDSKDSTDSTDAMNPDKIGDECDRCRWLLLGAKVPAERRQALIRIGALVRAVAADPRLGTSFQMDERGLALADPPAEDPACDWGGPILAAPRPEACPEALWGEHCWRGRREAARDEALRGGSARGVSARALVGGAPRRRGPRGSRRGPRQGLKQP
jgi:hypothetical protein